MKKILFVIFIVVPITFTMCKKANSSEQKTTVSGTLVNFPSRQALAGQKVYLVRQGITPVQYDPNPYWSIYYLDTLVWPTKYRVDSTITNANGNFSFSYNPADCQGYPCGGVYYPTVIDLNYVIVPLVSPASRDTIFVDHPSYFKLTLHKNSPAGVNDTLFEQRDFLNDQNLGFFPTAFRKAQVGQTITTITDTFSYNATKKMRLEWRHYKNGLIQSSIDTISLMPNNTTVYDVFY